MTLYDIIFVPNLAHYF